MNRRAVVTGIGVISPIGIGTEPFRENLRSAKCGIGRIESFDVEGFIVKFAGEVKDFEARKFIKQRKALKVMARDIQLAVAAANMAVEDAGLSENGMDPKRLGVCLGAGFMSSELDELGVAVAASRNDDGAFDIKKFGSEGMGNLFPLWLLKYLPNMPACHVSIIHNAQGPNNTITTDSTAASQAIGEALRVIQRGSADAMICGGAESKINPPSFMRYILWNLLSKRNDEPEKALRPFDRDADGLVLGEGAGIIVLEELEHARARGAKIYAEVAGYGVSCDTNAAVGGLPDARARSAAMINAMKDAAVSPSEVGFISAHGLGIKENDRAEVEAIKQAFGEEASSTPVTTVKPMMGHLCAGAGGVELIAAVLCLQDGMIPPILNCENPEPDFGLDFVRGEPRQDKVDVALVNTSSLAGQNASLILKRVEN